MEKAVLISMQPRPCHFVVIGEKYYEMRKTKPNLDTPFTCYMYATKSGDRIILKDDKVFEISKKSTGKVVGEFVCDHIIDVSYVALYTCYMGRDSKGVEEEFFAGTKVSYKEAFDYCIGSRKLSELNEKFYLWHISNLKIYDKPKDLSEFYYPQDRFCEKGLCGDCPKYETPSYEYGEVMFDCEWKKPLTRPPQSWCYVGPLSVSRDFTPTDFAPKTSYEDAFYTPYDGSCIVWMYYNPDSDAGGQYVTNFISLDDIKEAESKCIEADEFFDCLESIAKQKLDDIGTEFFEGAEEQFLKEPTYCDRTEETMNALIAFAHMQ